MEKVLFLACRQIHLYLDQNKQKVNLYLLDQLPFQNFVVLDQSDAGKMARNGPENEKSAAKNRPKPTFFHGNSQNSTSGGLDDNKTLPTDSSTRGTTPKVSSVSLYAKLFSPKVPKNAKKLDKTIRRARKPKLVSSASPMLRQSLLDSYVTSDGHKANEKLD